MTNSYVIDTFFLNRYDNISSQDQNNPIESLRKESTPISSNVKCITDNIHHKTKRHSKSNSLIGEVKKSKYSK